MKMLTLEDARGVFAAQLTSGQDLVWDRDYIESEDWWLIFYNTRAFYETDDDFLSLVGNGPFVVPKDGRTPFKMGSATSVEQQLADEGQSIVFSTFD
jgi:hypothetical protein